MVWVSKFGVALGHDRVLLCRTVEFVGGGEYRVYVIIRGSTIEGGFLERGGRKPGIFLSSSPVER